ncbi:MAG: HPr family phosphocarrier protein [Pseudomonadota bacterium]
MSVAPSLKRELEIVNKLGLHARASAKFVACVAAHDAKVTVTRDDVSVDGASIMGLMMLAAAPGCCIIVETEGPQAEEALEALTKLVADKFGEED